MARSTPRGGGSTGRSTPSTRSSSSRSPPREDPNASPSRLDAATLARLVEKTLPAAVASLHRLESFLDENAVNCEMDGPLTELINDIERMCHKVVQYSEHVTYSRVLVSHGSTIEDLIDRIVAQLKHSDNDLKQIQEKIENEHLRLMESLRPLRKTLNGLQLDSPASKKLLNSMRAIQYECLRVEERHGKVYRRICEFRILCVEMQHVSGFELPTPLIKTWRDSIEQSIIASGARLDKKTALKTAMAKTDKELMSIRRTQALQECLEQSHARIAFYTEARRKLEGVDQALFDDLTADLEAERQNNVKLRELVQFVVRSEGGDTVENSNPVTPTPAKLSDVATNSRAEAFHAAADGVIDANLRHDTDNMALDSTLGHRVNASDGTEQHKELSKRNLARKQQMRQRGKATAKEVVLSQTGQRRNTATAEGVVLGQTGQGTMATTEEVVLDQKRESKRRLALDPNSSTVDSKATVRGQAKTTPRSILHKPVSGNAEPSTTQAAARASDSPALAAASRTCDAPTSQVGPSGQRSRASADHSSPVDIDHSPQAATEPRCTSMDAVAEPLASQSTGGLSIHSSHTSSQAATELRHHSMDAVAAQLVLPSVGSSNTSGPHVTNRRLDRLEGIFQVLATTVQNDRQQIAHNFERVSKQAKVLRARVGGALDELDAKVEARVSRLETATRDTTVTTRTLGGDSVQPSARSESETQDSTGPRARNRRRNIRRREKRKAARLCRKQDGARPRAPPTPPSSRGGDPSSRGKQSSRPPLDGEHIRRPTTNLNSMKENDNRRTFQAKKKTQATSSGIANIQVQLTKKKASESSEMVSFVSANGAGDDIMRIPVSGFEHSKLASPIQIFKLELAAPWLGLILDYKARDIFMK